MEDILEQRFDWAVFAAFANSPGNLNTCILIPSSLWILSWKQLEEPAAQASRRSRKNG